MALNKAQGQRHAQRLTMATSDTKMLLLFLMNFKDNALRGDHCSSKKSGACGFLTLGHRMLQGYAQVDRQMLQKGRTRQLVVVVNCLDR
jgi:hypothetical protein